MASVSISKWDIAEALGLEWVGTYASVESVCEFEFHGKYIYVVAGMKDWTDVKEEAAQQVLDVLGKIIAGRMVADATVK